MCDDRPSGDRPALKIVRALPNGMKHPVGGEAALQRLIGAMIVEVGSPAVDMEIDGGGLVIEYLKDGHLGCLVLAFDEGGAWVERDEYPAIRRAEPMPGAWEDDFVRDG